MQSYVSPANEQSRNDKGTLKLFSIFLLILLFCQLSDRIALKYSEVVINDKLFFGLYLSNDCSIILALVLTLVIIIASKLLKWPWAIMAIFLAATLSNIIDRVVFGGVVDYLHLPPIPTFNLADVAIVSSVFILLVWQIKKDIQKTV